MDKIKTRLIIAVTGRLSAAAETTAKVELIEELSENLYNRYLEFTVNGMGEEEAYQKALEELGDVEELLAYLESLGPDGKLPKRESADAWSMDDILRGAEEVVRETVAQTKDAMSQAKVIVREVAEKIKEKYPNGFSGSIHIHTDGQKRHQGQLIPVTPIPADGVQGVDIQLVNGDVTIRLDDDPAAAISLEGDVEELEVRLREDGILSIQQTEKTASSSFFSIRGLSSADAELTLPARRWASIQVSTVNGDVELQEGLEAERLTVKSVSGDVDCRAAAGSVKAESVSGDVSLSGAFHTVSADTKSGDISVEGSAQEIKCASASGDIDLDAQALPQRMELSTKSGDCSATIPDEGVGFTLNYSTVSGELMSDFPLTGPVGARSGRAVYLDGGAMTYSIASVSGDIELHRRG